MKKPTFVVLLVTVALSAAAPVVRADRVLAPELPPSDSGVPASTDEASAFFDIGVLIGKVEQGAADGADPESLVFHLLEIRERAAKVGGDHSPVPEIEALIEAMESAKESRDLYPRIVAFRRDLAIRIARQDAPEPEVVEPFDCDIGSWGGVWETTWGDMVLVFEEDGRFHGTYGPSQHAVSGEFDPDNPRVLRGHWTHFGTHSPGGIRFEMKAPNRFEGGWSNEVPVDGAGSGWNGTRRRTHHSEILIVPIGEATVARPPEDKMPTWSQRFLIKKGFSVHGRNADFPFIQIYTLSPETGEWEKTSPLYEETGEDISKIPAGAAFTIDLSLPEEIARRPIVVEFGREAVVDDEERFISLRTRPLRMVPPRPDASEEKIPPEGEDSADEGEEVAPGEAADPPAEGDEPGPP